MDRERNRFENSFFYLSLAIFPLSFIVQPVLRMAGLGSMALKSAFFGYAIILLLQYVYYSRYGISLNRLAFLLGMYLLYLMLYFTTIPEMRHKFLQTDMTMIYWYYLPYYVLILSKIEDFTYLFTAKWIDYLNCAIILLAFIVKYFNLSKVDYMPYSYYLLPIWGLHIYRVVYQVNWYRLLTTVIMFLEGILFGARGPIVWSLVTLFSMMYFIGIAKRTRWTLSLKKLKTFFIGLGIVTIVITLVIYLLLNLPVASSYILSRLNAGVLAKSDGRSAITYTATEYLKENGFLIRGLFFDRTILPEGLYSHNLILETFISFGWILGGSILLLLFSSFIIVLSKIDAWSRSYLVLFCILFLLRFTITGSIYDDNTFLLYLSLLYAMSHSIEKQREAAKTA